MNSNPSFRVDRLILSSVLALCASALLPVQSHGQPATNGRIPQAPPPAVHVVGNPSPHPLTGNPPPEGMTPYNFGNPTDEEQLYLEYINRARTNPPLEGLRLATTTDPNVLSAYAYFGVDTNLMQSQFDAIAATPPLAFNADLIAAARWHSGDMYTNEYQGHVQTNGDGSTLDPGQRITAEGYTWQTYGENVYATALYPFYGHAGFEVDWGPGTGGMQTPPGHRENIHDGTFREIGVGIVDGTHGPVGPQIVTQDFATMPSATPLITGVVYYDVNGNGFYDIGEGIGGVTVQVPGSTYFAITANSGGYTVPISSNGMYVVSFSANGLSHQTTQTVAGLNNVKVDFIPPYSPPTVSGPNPASLTNNNTYTFTTVPTATNYQCVIQPLLLYTNVEGAENGTNNVTIVSSDGYSVFAMDLKESGAYSFHLCHPYPSPVLQSITLNPTFLATVNSQLMFWKLLGFSGDGEVARAQVSTNGGTNWTDVWNEVGSDSSGDSSFSQITESLAAYAGQMIQVRFVYDFVGGSYYNQTSTGVGLYLDNISFTNIEELLPSTTNNVPSGNQFVLNPTNLSEIYQLTVNAQLSGHTLPPGPADQVSVSAFVPPMTIQFARPPSVSNNLFRATFTVGNYQSGKAFTLLKSSNLAGGWSLDPGASFKTNIPNTQFQVTTSVNTNNAFYRVQAN